MPPKLNWKFKKGFESSTDLATFMDTIICASTSHNNKKNCYLNECDSDINHEMRIIRLKCTHKDCENQCNVKYLIEKCDISKIYNLYQLNEHDNNEIDNFVRTNNEVKIKKHGLLTIVKELIEEIINTKNITKAKKIYIKLHGKKYKDRKNIYRCYFPH
jgi:hypothetical protein